MNDFYKDYSEYMAGIFPGMKVQKISLNAGFTCPNRDGTFGHSGCAYCNNVSFTPSYCMEGDSVGLQLEKGRAFFSRKYPRMKYLAYFQSYTNTYGASLQHLSRLWEEALAQENVVGLDVATRPDCLSQEVVEALRKLNSRVPVFVELGAESADDEVLKRVDRHHGWAEVEDAARRCADAGLHVGLHLIAGLPGDSAGGVLNSVDAACSLPIDSVKLHHLQVIKGTRLHDMWQRREFSLLFPDAESYLQFCVEVVRHVPSHICIERFLASSPPSMVAAPSWGMKNHEFVNALHNLLRRLNVENSDR